jgi:hypothetical protein
MGCDDAAARGLGVWETLTVAGLACEHCDRQADVQKHPSSRSPVADYDSPTLGSGTNLA